MSAITMSLFQISPHTIHNRGRFLARLFDQIFVISMGESQLEHDRTEEVCIQMDELAQKDFSYHMTASRILSIQKELVDLSQ